MFASKSKRNYNPWGNDNPEKLPKSYSSTIGFKDQVKKLVTPTGMVDQILGAAHPPETAPHLKNKETLRNNRDVLVFSFQENITSKALKTETEQIINELKREVTLLQKAEKNLTSDITKIKVEQIPDKTGIYYLRYFQWLIGIIRQMRVKIDEGRAWLATFNQRKKKMGYWGMYKKHGTNFGLSNERTMATQTG